MYAIRSYYGIDLTDSGGRQGMLVPQLINLIGDAAPWLVGLLFGQVAGGIIMQFAGWRSVSYNFV